MYDTDYKRFKKGSIPVAQGQQRRLSLPFKEGGLEAMSPVHVATPQLRVQARGRGACKFLLFHFLKIHVNFFYFIKKKKTAAHGCSGLNPQGGIPALL